LEVQQEINLWKNSLEAKHFDVHKKSWGEKIRRWNL